MKKCIKKFTGGIYREGTEEEEAVWGLARVRHFLSELDRDKPFPTMQI